MLTFSSGRMLSSTSVLILSKNRVPCKFMNLNHFNLQLSCWTGKTDFKKPNWGEWVKSKTKRMQFKKKAYSLLLTIYDAKVLFSPPNNLWCFSVRIIYLLSFDVNHLLIVCRLTNEQKCCLHEHYKHFISSGHIGVIVCKFRKDNDVRHLKKV